MEGEETLLHISPHFPLHSLSPNLQQFFHFQKEAILAGDEKKQVKDEKTMEEIEELRRAKAEELSRVKREFEEGKAGGNTIAESAAQAQKETLEGWENGSFTHLRYIFHF